MNVELQGVFPKVELEIEPTGCGVAAVAIENVSMNIYYAPVRHWWVTIHCLNGFNIEGWTGFEWSRYLPRSSRRISWKCGAMYRVDYMFIMNHIMGSFYDHRGP